MHCPDKAHKGTHLMYWLDTWDGYTVFLGVRGCPVAFRNRGQLPLSNPLGWWDGAHGGMVGRRMVGRGAVMKGPKRNRQPQPPTTITRDREESSGEDRGGAEQRHEALSTYSTCIISWMAMLTMEL